jgi:hypothetical protein
MDHDEIREAVTMFVDWLDDEGAHHNITIPEEVVQDFLADLEQGLLG